MATFSPLSSAFAEDVWLLPKDSFKNLLAKLRDTPEHVAPVVAELWQKMNAGGFSTSLGLPVLWFNGGLFEDATALPLTRGQFLLLTEAAGSDWREVEPAIFGTLLERALAPVERHRLGGHFSPRAYGAPGPRAWQSACMPYVRSWLPNPPRSRLWTSPPAARAPPPPT